MHNQDSSTARPVSSRCLKLFKKYESDEDKEFRSCCCILPRKGLLTGFAEVAKSKTCRRTSIKLLVSFVCASGFFYQTWQFLQMYLAYPVALDISEDYPDSFSRPAVSICHHSRLFRQPYCRAFPKKCTWQYTTWESFCSKYRRMCPAHKPANFSFGIPIFDQGHPNRSIAIVRVAGLNFETGNPIVVPIDKEIEFGFHHIPFIVPYNRLEYRCFTLFSLVLIDEYPTITIAEGYVIIILMRPEEYFNTVDLVQASVLVHDAHRLVNPMVEGITLTAGRTYQMFPTMGIEVFSYIGGYLGMWLGISLSSLLDLAEMMHEVIGYIFRKDKTKAKKGQCRLNNLDCGSVEKNE